MHHTRTNLTVKLPITVGWWRRNEGSIRKKRRRVVRVLVLDNIQPRERVRKVQCDRKQMNRELCSEIRKIYFLFQTSAQLNKNYPV